MAQGSGAFKRVQVEPGIRQTGPTRWEVQVHVGRDPLTGKLRQMSRTTHYGIRAARKLRAELILEAAKINAEADEKRAAEGVEADTFGRLLDEWMALGKRLGRSPNTLAGSEDRRDQPTRTWRHPGRGPHDENARRVL